jgi:hypothetical protein
MNVVRKPGQNHFRKIGFLLFINDFVHILLPYSTPKSFWKISIPFQTEDIYTLMHFNMQVAACVM